MGVLTWAITGVGAGFLSKAIAPGRAGEPAGLTRALLLGISAAVFLGLAWNLAFARGAVTQAGLPSILAAYGGATALLMAVRARPLRPAR